MTDKAAATPSQNPGPKAGASLVDEAKHALVNVAGLAADQAEQSVSGTKDRAAEGLGSVVNALRSTGDELGGTSAAVKGYVDQAADQVERFSEYVRDRDMVQIAGDVEKFARREPALFLGGAFVLGLCAARFLKSSAASASTPHQLQVRPQRQLAARSS